MSVPPESAILERLGRCHGYLVVARDGMCGAVETPLFPPEGGHPDFLIIRLGQRAGARLPIVPVALVSWVDSDRELVYLDATERELATLPEHLPLEI